MPRIWPAVLVLLMAGCSAAPPPLQTGMPPPQGFPMGGPGMMAGMPGMGGPGGMGMPPGGLDPALMAPLGGGTGGFGTMDGLAPDGGGLGGLGMGMAAAGPGSGLALGGNTLFDRPLPGLLHTAALPEAAGGPPPAAPAPAEGAAPVSKPAPEARTVQAKAHGPIVISSRIQSDPTAIRIQTAPTDTGADVTLAVPLTGEVALSAADHPDRRMDLPVAGIATARVRLAKAGTNVWKPTGIGVLVSVSDDEPPFVIASLTIAAAGGRTWTITDPTAMAAFDQLPNIPPGTKVTVTVTVSGDTAQAMPFIVANGKLLHAKPVGGSPATEDREETRTFSRTFTLAPLTLTKDHVTLRKETGMIGVKVLNLASLPAPDAKPKAAVEATGWAVVFPSQESGRDAGFAALPDADRLHRHVQAILDIVSAADNRGQVLVSDDSPSH